MSEQEQRNESKDKQLQFMVLYDGCHARLGRFCRAVSWDNEEAKDLLSETVLQAYENFEKIRKPESFLYYLFGTASRLHKKKLRRLKFKGLFRQEQADNLVDLAARPDDELELHILFTAMRKLPPEQCEALTLFEISGLNLNEIREIQQCSLSAVKARISRARQKLARMLNTRDVNLSLDNEKKKEILINKIESKLVNISEL
jgi:RNA polymerase sigma-70 factor, ECF subfamily